MNVAFQKLLGGGLQILRRHAVLKVKAKKSTALLLKYKVPVPLQFVVFPKCSAIPNQVARVNVSQNLRQNAFQRLFSPFKYRGLVARPEKSYIKYIALGLGFVPGFSLVDNTHHGSKHLDVITSLRDQCQFLRNKAHVKKQSKTEAEEEVVYPNYLQGYKIADHLIAKGSYGAVFPIKIAEHQETEKVTSCEVSHCDATHSSVFHNDKSKTTDDFLSLEKMEIGSSKESSASSAGSLAGSCEFYTAPSEPPLIQEEQSVDREQICTQRPPPSKEDSKIVCSEGEFCDLVLKIVFNDKTRSDAAAIESAYKAEMILVTERCNPTGKTVKRLPKHPNIIKVHQAFVDYNVSPHLKEAMDHFPYALPRDQFERGHGRNMLLYLVMPRYEMTLHQYLDRPPFQSEQMAKIMLCQLLEGATHLRSFKIAHCDIKDNNILVKLDSSKIPHLVIADFGCCIDGEDSDLRVGGIAARINGNQALMAPEIARYSKSLYVNLDYRKSDGWALGTIAYQICGMKNPFYKKGIDSVSYDEMCLPKLPSFVSPEFDFVIQGLLKKEPIKRLSCAEAANMIHLLLWKHEQWDAGPVNLMKLFSLHRKLPGWLSEIANPVIKGLTDGHHMTPVVNPKTPDRRAEKHLINTDSDERNTRGQVDSTVKLELLATFLSRVNRKGILRAAEALTYFKWQRWLKEQAMSMNISLDVQ